MNPNKKVLKIVLAEKKTHKTFPFPKTWCFSKSRWYIHQMLCRQSNVLNVEAPRISSWFHSMKGWPSGHPSNIQVQGKCLVPGSSGDMLFVKFGSLFPQGSKVNKKQKTFELPPPWWLVYRDPGLVYGFHPLYNWVGFHPLYISQTTREFIAQVGFPHISPTENSQVKRIPPFRLRGFWRFLGHLRKI